MKTSALTQFSTIPTSIEDNRGMIEQPERLFTARPRFMFANTQAGGDRGERAYIRLLTTNSRAKTRGNPHEGYSGATSIRGTGEAVDQATSTSVYGGYADFLLTDARVSLDEKIQIAEVFGDGEVTYYFGRQPIIFSLSGMLIDSVDNNWFVQWMEMYGHVMRGTMLAKNQELLHLVLPNMELVGTIMRMSYAQNSGRDQDIPFEFQFLAKQLIPKPVIMSGVSLSSEIATVDFAQSDSFLSQSGINSVKGGIDRLGEVIRSPFSTVADITEGLLGVRSGLQSDVRGPGGVSTTGNGGSSGQSIFGTIGTTLAGVRSAVFSPIYGVMSSLTKLVRNISGDVNRIFSALANPVRDIIRDVRNISNQAIGLVSMVNNTIGGITGQVRAIDNNAQLAIANLKNAAGVITSAPKTVSESIGRLVRAGTLPITTGYLQNKPRAVLGASFGTGSKTALLAASGSNSPSRGAFL